MKKGQNFNHPKRGAQIKVEPIKRFKDIKAIKKLLAGMTCPQVIYYILS